MASQGGKAHASPSLRKFSRELGVGLVRLKGSGPKGRLQHVQNYVKAVMAGATASGSAPAAAGRGGALGIELLPWPALDFSKSGPTELRLLPRIQKISGRTCVATGP